MTYTTPLMTLLFTVLLAVMTPEPSFLMVVRASIAYSRSKGITAALGMGAGSALLALLASLGIRTIFTTFPWLFPTLQFCGGIYLWYIGARLWQNAKMHGDAENTGTVLQMRKDNFFHTTFLVQISNPQTILFFSSIFAAILPSNTTAGVTVILLILVFLIQSAWYALVAVLFSANGPRTAYMHAHVWIDRITGSLILFLSVKLLRAAFL